MCANQIQCDVHTLEMIQNWLEMELALQIRKDSLGGGKEVDPSGLVPMFTQSTSLSLPWPKPPANSISTTVAFGLSVVDMTPSHLWRFVLSAWILILILLLLINNCINSFHSSSHHSSVNLSLKIMNKLSRTVIAPW